MANSSFKIWWHIHNSHPYILLNSLVTYFSTHFTAPKKWQKNHHINSPGRKNSWNVRSNQSSKCANHCWTFEAINTPASPWIIDRQSVHLTDLIAALNDPFSICKLLPQPPLCTINILGKWSKGDIKWEKTHGQNLSPAAVWADGMFAKGAKCHIRIELHQKNLSFLEDEIEFSGSTCQIGLTKGAVEEEASMIALLSPKLGFQQYVDQIFPQMVWGDNHPKWSLL